MNGHRKSDSFVVPEKSANKAGQPVASACAGAASQKHRVRWDRMQRLCDRWLPRLASTIPIRCAACASLPEAKSRMR